MTEMMPNVIHVPIPKPKRFTAHKVGEGDQSYWEVYDNEDVNGMPVSTWETWEEAQQERDNLNIDVQQA